MRNLLLLTLIARCLAECTAPQPVDGLTRDRLTNHYWGLRRFLGNKVAHAEPEAASLRFRPNGQIDGTASCNSIGGSRLNWSATTVGNAGSFSHNNAQPMIQTAVGCGDRRSVVVANDFWQRMDAAEAWSLQDGRLQITFSDGGTAELVSITNPLLGRGSESGRKTSNNFDHK